MAPKSALVMTYGTRGDVEPFVALALGLRDAGFAPTLAAPARFRSSVEAHGLAFAELSDAVLGLIDSPDGWTVMHGGAGIWAQIAAGMRLARRAAPLNAGLMRQAWAIAAALRPDVIVFHPKATAAPHIAERLEIPAIMGCLQPMVVPTRAFPASTVELPLPGFNRATYALVRLASARLRAPVNRFRTQTLALPPIRHASEVLFPPGAGRIPVLHAISPEVLPRPADWPDHALMTGYWRRGDRAEVAPGADVVAFLERGPAPVYVGFGSMPSRDPQDLARTITGALRRCGLRGVIASGWAGLAVDPGEDVLCVPELPHAWAFPRMCALVHHGGAGTTAEALVSGIPSVVCPAFGDQGFWARRLAAMGVSPPPVSRRRLSERTLAEAIQAAVGDDGMRQRAKAVSARLAGEDGVGRAVEIVVRAVNGSGD